MKSSFVYIKHLPWRPRNLHRIGSRKIVRASVVANFKETLFSAHTRALTDVYSKLFDSMHTPA